MIYAIRAGEDGPIKIGRAGNPDERLRELQTAQFEVLRLITKVPLPDYREKVVHTFLEKDRIRGEWFAPTERTFTAIEYLNAEAKMKELGYEWRDDAHCPSCALKVEHSLANGLWV